MVKVKQLMVEWSRDQIMAAAAALGYVAVKSGVAWAFTDEQSAAIIAYLELPVEIKPKLYNAMYRHEAKNPRYIFCTVEGHEDMGKVPVLMSTRMGLRDVQGKVFQVEKIVDAEGGITWRHEWFQRHQFAK